MTVASYCLWAFDRTGLSAHAGHHVVWIELTVVPLVLAVLHILRLLDAGKGGEPEQLALHDHILQGYGAALARPDGRRPVRVSARGSNLARQPLSGWGRTAPTTGMVCRPGDDAAIEEVFGLGTSRRSSPVASAGATAMPPSAAVA